MVFENTRRLHQFYETEHQSSDFAKIHDAMFKPAFLFDGRNILDHDSLEKLGFDVYSIGKG